MSTKASASSAFLALSLVVVFLLSWEGFWRSRGFEPTFHDDKSLWVKERRKAYRSPGNATIFIGSSRIKFALDIPTWEELTGEEAVQLSLVGTSPILVLHDLARDTAFAGKVVVDVTEPLFFSGFPPFHKSAVEATRHFQDQTPSERLSAGLSLALESRLTFLEEERFGLNALLSSLPLPNRPGVFQFPSFPKGFAWTTGQRQTYMSDLFLADSNAIRWQTEIWNILLLKAPDSALRGEELDRTLEEIRASVAAIRSRGGEVIFTRTPSSGPMLDFEKERFPRTDYWDRLLAVADAPGLHFEDYAPTADYHCPEWSHLTVEDAIDYTHHLVDLLARRQWFN